MANFDINAWESLVLVKRLKEIDENAWYDIKYEINGLAPLLYWRPIGLEEYTDHDLNHCFRIVQSLGQIIPSDFSLTKHELCILLYSVLFHDLGMWTKKSESERAMQDENFLAYFKKVNGYDRISTLLFSNVKEDKYLGNLLLRQVVAQYNRLHHAERTRLILSGIAVDSDLSLRIPEEYLPLVGIICAAHDWDTDDVLRSDLLDDYRLTPTDYIDENDDELIVDVRLLSFLLRIGDLLDLDSRRISRIIWRYLENMSVESEAHWRKHECLRFKRMNKDEITIVGDYNYDRYGQLATEAFHLAQQWCLYLKNEIETLQKAMRTPERYAMKSGRKLGALFLDTQGVKGTGIIFADNLSFDMNKSRIIEILGDEIYEDKSSFIRELIQNAIDATRTQIVDDYKTGKAKSAYPLDLRSPTSWPRAITEKEEYAIRITTGMTSKRIKDQDKKLLFFEVADHGIGMTVDQVKNYFLQIGRSYYKSNDFRTKYDHSSISRFGIGFLSCLLVGEYIEVDTKTRDNGGSLKLIMDNNSDIVSIVTGEKADFGTTVRVFFEPEIVEDSGWLPKEQLNEDILKFTHPDLVNSSKLLQAIHYWIPWNEISIIVNNQKLKPRSPKDIKSNEKYWSFPYRVISAEDDEVLAVGSMIFERNTMVPRFDDRDEIETHFLPSIGGVIIPPWKRAMDAVAYIDLYRQPDSIITASRRAKFEIPSSKVKKEIIKNVLWAIDRVLGEKTDETGILYQALFRASICIEMEDVDLLLPVVREGQLKWEYWNKKRFSMETCALVPFFTPIEYPNIQFSIPIVGVPRRYFDCPRDVIPKIESVRAISINGKFTAALSQSNAWFHVDEIDEKYTYLLYKFVKYDKSNDQWTIINNDIAAQEPIRQQMPDWDKEYGNMWNTLGFDPYESSCWAYVINHYGGDGIGRDISIPTVDVRIPRRDWNRLEKPTEMDWRIKGLIKYLRGDPE